MSDAGDLQALGDWVRDLTRHFTPAERRALARRVGVVLRKANAQRIRRNVTPEGAPMAPRKPGVGEELRKRRGGVRRDLMFRKAAKPAWLRSLPRDAGVDVGFVGAVARIMRVHQLGLRDTVSREAGAPTVQYPARPVVGDTAADREAVMDTVLDAIAG